MEKKQKLKMSNRKFRAILIPIMSIVLILALVINAAASMLGSTLDTYVGAGSSYVVTPDRVKGWDANYYQTLYANNT